MASFVENASLKNDYFTRLEVDDADGNEFTDRWNTGELLCLASAVQRSGDKNWVSVSRSIKPFGEPRRPADWYTPKNCALQYSKLLRGVEDFKKKSLPRTERETSEELLVKNLTDKRITELNWLNTQTKVLANSLKVHMELLESGEYDDQLDELLKQIEEQEKKEEDDLKEWILRREALNVTKKLNKCRVPLTKGKAPLRVLDSKRKNSPNRDHTDDVSIHTAEVLVKTEVDTDHEFSLITKPVTIKKEPIDTPSNISALFEGTKAANVPPSPLSTPTSPLLTSLLRNVSSSNAASPVVSYANSPLKEVKVESSSQSSNTNSTDNVRKTEVFLSPTKTVIAGVSPLLTSLLKSPTSTAPTSTSMASHLKEGDAADIKVTEIDMAALIAKSQETSPRASVPHSPRPTPASSPLLNSLLKSSPTSASPLTSSQFAQPKEASPSKVVSSPQSFFNPTSALATAAAQQLAVATSSPSLSHVFFPQDSSESQKRSIQSSPVTSACLSAPTLSKLLEMPPSTPGRLPPLPVVENVNTTTAAAASVVVPEQTVSQSPKKVSTATELLSELQSQIAAVSPSKKSVDSCSPSKVATIPDQQVQEKISMPAPSVDISSTSSTTVVGSAIIDEKVPFKRPGELDDTSQENIDILEAVCEAFEDQAFEEKEILQVAAELDIVQHQGKINETLDGTDLKHDLKEENVIPDEVINAALNIEKLISSDDMNLDDKVFSSEDITDPTDLNIFDDDKLKNEMETENPPNTAPSTETVPESIDEEKAGGRKFYKSRSTSKKRPSTDDDKEKPMETIQTPKQGMKRPHTPRKSESEVLPQVPVNEQLLLAAKEAEEATMCKTPDKSPSKSSEIRSPIAKKPRLFEKTASKEIKEKKEMSEDETPVAKRPGRKETLSAKKGRKSSRSTPVKQDEPKDQYEFSESTEENSVGYQATNSMCCYMPRPKDDIRLDENKAKQPQVSEESSVVPEKKYGTPTKTKSGKLPSQTSARKNLFTSDEERMSDSLTSDEASNSHLGDDKIKKWKELNEKKEFNQEDDSTKNLIKGTKIADSPKKKLQHTKRNLFSSKSDTPKKEKKSVSSDVEESSICSRDSEDVASTAAWQREDGEANETKIANLNVTDDVEVEANDSYMSSAMTVESDNKMDEMEGYESLQGSVTTSPLPQSDMKEEKDTSHFGKQDWFQGASPKSSEPVSQSSEESEYESDNWDNQSVSTNKSASHSAGPSTKSKRKERETPQYKAWKKAISIVLREASCHKYANVFLQKVTNDVAPGYLNIVNRPMDLSLIKKNVDNGVVRTTAEVHRDMLLMFQNAVMYNSSDHDVHHMAIEMQRDVIQQIQAFLTTQYNDKDESNELTSLRGVRAKSQKGYGSVSKSKEDAHEKE